MKKALSSKKSQEKFDKHLDSNNSFLVETSFNSDIDMNIRQEIDYKYNHSKINSVYKFPRTISNKKQNSKQISAKSFENLQKNLPIHKNSKSSFNPLAEEFKFPDKTTGKGISLNLKFPTSTKIGFKREPGHTRVFSSRFLKTERTQDSKSPRQKKSFINIYANNLKLSGHNGASEILTKGKSNWALHSRILNPNGSIRLRNIYKKVKGTNLI